MERASIKFIAFFFVILAFASTFAQGAESSSVIPNDGATRKLPETSCVAHGIIRCSNDWTCIAAGCKSCEGPDEHAPYYHCH